MGGLPVNVREQQGICSFDYNNNWNIKCKKIISDAFEFYSRLTEQIDDHLKTLKMDPVFTKRFEGLYSIQRICQDCPHR